MCPASLRRQKHYVTLSMASRFIYLNCEMLHKLHLLRKLYVASVTAPGVMRRGRDDHKTVLFCNKLRRRNTI